MSNPSTYRVLIEPLITPKIICMEKLVCSPLFRVFKHFFRTVHSPVLAVHSEDPMHSICKSFYKREEGEKEKEVIKRKLMEAITEW